MPRTPLPPEDVLALLREGPGRIAALTMGCPVEILGTPPEPGEWSAGEILAHLRACDDVWDDYVARIVREDHPTIRAFSPRGSIRTTGFLEWAFEPALEAFRTQRNALLAILEPLPAQAWARPVTIVKSGRPREQTLLTYVDGMAAHEQIHLEQIARTIAALDPNR